jgi:putative endonuclease
LKSYYVYIATNRSGTLYTGVTNDLERRMAEHRSGQIKGFTSKYQIDTLVYFEETSDVRAAIAREKEIKGWRRSKKIDLLRSANPSWQDLQRDSSLPLGMTEKSEI